MLLVNAEDQVVLLDGDGTGAVPTSLSSVTDFIYGQSSTSLNKTDEMKDFDAKFSPLLENNTQSA